MLIKEVPCIPLFYNINLYKRHPFFFYLLIQSYYIQSQKCMDLFIYFFNFKPPLKTTFGSKYKVVQHRRNVKFSSVQWFKKIGGFREFILEKNEWSYAYLKGSPMEEKIYLFLLLQKSSIGTKLKDTQALLQLQDSWSYWSSRKMGRYDSQPV